MATSLLLNPRTGGPFSAVEVSSTVTAYGGTILRVETSGGPLTVRAPTGPSAVPGMAFAVLDVDGDADTNPITVDGNGLTIDGGASVILDDPRELAVFVSVGTEWRRVVPTFAVDNASLPNAFARFMPPADVGPVDLAGGSSSVVGILPTANGGTGSSAGVAPLIGPARGTPLDANHIHAWELTETTGASFADTGSSAQKVALAIANVANVQLGAAGPFGACPMFGATAVGGSAASQADALVSDFNDLPAQNWTLEAWAAPASIGTSQVNGIFGAGDASAANVQLAINGASVGTMAGIVRTTSFINGSGSSVLFNTQGALGAWRHYALIYRGTSADLYVDGELVGRAAGGSTATQWTNGTLPRIVIANQRNGGAPFYGKIARVRLSDIVRSQAYLRDVVRAGNLFAAAA